MDVDGGDEQILGLKPDPSEMLARVTQITQGPESDEPETLISAFSGQRLTAERDQDITTDEHNMPTVTDTIGAKPTDILYNPHHLHKKEDEAPVQEELPQQDMDCDSGNEQILGLREKTGGPHQTDYDQNMDTEDPKDNDKVTEKELVGIEGHRKGTRQYRPRGSELKDMAILPEDPRGRIGDRCLDAEAK